MAKKTMNLGMWAFFVGIVLAIVSGFFVLSWVPIVLFVLGLIVGFLNVTKKEMTSYLVAIIALLLVANSSVIALQVILGSSAAAVITSMLINFNAFVAASGLIVAIRSIVELGRN
ncbi:hypothetical protein COV13_01900 [Candidatus Woesearchaeota archaeon CG10_big_fil_rev_8_21_14_0_10_32_9]|nr:MAG: hypothetical protein COV13_01900 [Candidatus Woesearchaeota archaeon CG10_big_fil_rev_8_21_14_0_10_32_9]